MRAIDHLKMILRFYGRKVRFLSIEVIKVNHLVYTLRNVSTIDFHDKHSTIS